MSLQYTINGIPATGAVAVYNLKTALKAQGWTVPRSSDGTTYLSSGDQITSGSSGANGLANSSAWFVIQMPTANGVNRQFCFQRSTSQNTQWRVKYSYSAGFTGGSPSATVTPTATDQVVIQGAGTDGSPSYSTIYPSDGTYRQNIAVDSATPYGFWEVVFPTGGGVPNHNTIWDPMLSGSAPSSDTDPYVFICGGGNSVTQMSGTTANNMSIYQSLNQPTPFAYLGTPGTTSNYVGVAAQQYAGITAGSATYAHTATGTQPFSSKDDIWPVIYLRNNSQTSPIGYKGVSSLLSWISTNRSTGDTLTVVTTSDYIVFGAFVAAWNGTTPSV